MISKIKLFEALKYTTEENYFLEDAMSSDEVYDKYYKDIPKEEYDILVSLDPTSKEDKIGTYSKWILKIYKTDKKIIDEDADKLTEALQIFDKFKSKMQIKDINQIRSLNQLREMTEQFAEQKTNNEIKKEKDLEISKDAKKVYEDSIWLVVVPLSYEASCKYGANTKWCTAGETRNWYDTEAKKGPLFIIINKKKTKDCKWQFHLESGQFKNELDIEVSIVDTRIKEKMPNDIFKAIMSY